MAGITDYIPNIAVDTSGFGKGVLIIIIIGFIVAVLSVGFFFIMRYLKFNKKIHIYKKVYGRYELVRKDKAQQMNLKGTGDTVFYLKKSKKYLPTPNLQAGRNLYWFVIREDGEWINIGMEDIDEKFREVGAKFLDTEVRYARTQLQGHIKDRYDKPNFWAQHGVLVVNIAALTIILVFLFLIVQDLQEIAGAVSASVDAAGRVNEAIASQLGSLDVITGGSGIAPAE